MIVVEFKRFKGMKRFTHSCWSHGCGRSVRWPFPPFYIHLLWPAHHTPRYQSITPHIRGGCHTYVNFWKVSRFVHLADLHFVIWANQIRASCMHSRRALSSWWPQAICWSLWFFNAIFQNHSWVKHNGSCLPRSRPPNQLVVVMQGCGHTVTGSVGQDTLERWVR